MVTHRDEDEDEEEEEEIEARVLIPAKSIHQKIWRDVVHAEAASLQDFKDLEDQIMHECADLVGEDQGLMDVDIEGPEENVYEELGIYNVYQNRQTSTHPSA